jgi:hypothetical protein
MMAQHDNDVAACVFYSALLPDSSTLQAGRVCGSSRVLLALSVTPYWIGILSHYKY